MKMSEKRATMGIFVLALILGATAGGRYAI